MPNASVALARAGRVSGPTSAWPQWTVSRSHATRDEGLSFSFTITANNSTRLPKRLRFRLRRPNDVGGILVTANTSDFDLSFVDAVVLAAAAKNAAYGSVVLKVNRISENESEIFATSGWDGTLQITRTSLNNPAAQGNLFTGMEVHSVSEGTILVAAIGTTINDVNTAAGPPTNLVAPSFTDLTPTVGVQNTINDGEWSLATSWERKVQREISGSEAPVTFTDNGNRSNEVMTASANWLLGAGTAANMTVFSQGFGTASGVGTVVLYTGAGSTNHGVKFTAKTGSGPRERMILKWVDINNYIYVEVSKDLATNGIRATRVIAGTPTTHTFTTTARVSGATYEVTYYAGVLTLKINGVETGTSYTLSAAELTALGASTARGMGTAANSGAPAFDNVVITDYVVGAAIAEDIPDALLSVFTPTTSEQSKRIRPAVRGIGIGGAASDWVYGDWTAAVEAAPVVAAPTNSVAPSFANDPVVGQAVSLNLGTWTGADSFTIDRVEEEIASVWTPIASSSGTVPYTYTPVSGSVGRRLRAVVTGTGLGGSLTVNGTPTIAVAAAPVTDATDATLGTDPLTYVTVGAATDTVVGNLIGNGVINTAVILANGDAGGRYKITGSSPDFQVKVAAVLPDFFGPLHTNFFGRTNVRNPYTFDTISIRFNDAFDKTFTIRRRDPDLDVAITGGVGGIETSANTAGTIFSTSGLLGTGTTGRIIHVPDHNVHGVFKHSPTTPNAKEDGRSNCTYVGHPGGILRQGRGLQKKVGSNVRYQNIPFLAGAHQSTAEQYDLIDTIEFGNMNIGATNVVKLIEFFHTQHHFSLDELASFIGFGPYPRQILIHYSEFSAALHDRRQPGNIPHPYGPLVHTFSDSIVFHHNLIAGAPMRSPRLTGVVSGLVQNNVVFPRNTNLTGHSVFSCAGASGTTEQHIAYDFASNIIIPDTSVSYNTVIQGIVGLLDVPAGSEINLNIGVPGRENFIVRMVNGAPDFANAVPLSLANCVAQGTRTANPLPIVNYRPMSSVSDYGHQSSSTPTELEAIYNEVMDKAGSRKQVGDVYTGDYISGDLALNYVSYLIRQALRTTANCGYPTAASLATAWGTEWTGGGTNTFGMHYLWNGTTWTDGGV